MGNLCVAHEPCSCFVGSIQMWIKKGRGGLLMIV